jgi:hypothetical protein
MGQILDLHRLVTPQADPASFLEHFPGAFLQYFDDSSERDPRKAVSISRHDGTQAERKQREGCGVGFSPNGFVAARRLDCLKQIQAVFLDLDCAKEGDGTDLSEIERRKEEKLLRLVAARLPPHAITETKNGLQPIWRVVPLGVEPGVRLFREAIAILLRRFGGDPGATDPTHVMRLPGTLHLKDPSHPFRCRLLWDDLHRAPEAIQSIIDEFYLPPLPRVSGVPSKFPHTPRPSTFDIGEVIVAAAREAGIGVTLRQNRDGSRQIVEDGEVTSGFISARGNFCHSMSGKPRKGGPIQLVQYYLGLDRDAAGAWLSERFGYGGGRTRSPRRSTAQHAVPPSAKPSQKDHPASYRADSLARKAHAAMDGDMPSTHGDAPSTLSA